jgi:hypothetical protein
LTYKIRRDRILDVRISKSTTDIASAWYFAGSAPARFCSLLAPMKTAMRLDSRLHRIVLAAVVAAAVSTSANAQSPAKFYRGKTINIYVGYAPGGSYDFYPRLFARHFGKYIPGNPNVVIQTMPGAGSLRAANYLFNVALDLLLAHAGDFQPASRVYQVAPQRVGL